MRHGPKDLDQLVLAMNSEELRACHAQLKRFDSKYAPALSALLRAVHRRASPQQQQKLMEKEGHPTKLKLARRILAEQLDLALMVHYRHLTGSMRMQAMHQKVEILLAKRLMAQAERSVNELLTLARSLHDLEAERAAMQQQITLMVDHGRGHLMSTLEAWKQRMHELTLQMHMEDELRALYKQLNALYIEKNDRVSDDELRWATQLMGHELLCAAPDGLAVHGRRQYHMAHSIFHQLKMETDKAVPHVMALIAIWNENPELKRDRPDLYRGALDQAFGIYFRSKRYEEAAPMVKAMRETVLWSHEKNLKLMTNLCINGMLVSLNMADRDGMLDELKTSLALIMDEGHRMAMSSQKAICYNAAVCCFLLEDNRHALRWLAILGRMQRNGVRKDLNRQALNLQLMLWHDMGKTELIDRHLRPQAHTEPLTDVLSELLRNCLEELSSCTKSRSDQQLWQGMADHLHGLFSGPRPIGFEEMDVWVRAHLLCMSRWEAFAAQRGNRPLKRSVA